MFFNYNNGIQINAPLDMMQKIFAALLDIFQEITVPIVPNKIGFYEQRMHSNDPFVCIQMFWPYRNIHRMLYRIGV